MRPAADPWLWAVHRWAPIGGVILVFCGALAHGGETLAGQGLILMAGAVGLAALATSPAGVSPRPMPLRLACLAWGGLIVWCIVQALPLGIFPHNAWQDAAAILALPVAGSIALDPQASLDAGLRLAAYAGLFCLGLGAARQASAVLGVVALGACLIAAAGVVAGPFDVGPLGLVKVRHIGQAAFPFANASHFCIFVALGGLAAAANLTRAENPRHKLWWCALLLIALVAVCASQSRAGLAVSVAAGAGFILCTMRLQRKVMVLLGVVCLVGTLFLAGTAGRFVGLAEAADLRAAIIAPAFSFAASTPWAGIGSFDLGFQTVAPSYSQGLVQTAHSAFAEVWAERGWPGGLLAVAAVIFLVAWVFPAARQHGLRDPVAAVGVAAPLLVAVHSLIDASLFVPAIAATTAILAGLGVGALGLSQAQSVWNDHAEGVRP